MMWIPFFFLILCAVASASPAVEPAKPSPGITAKPPTLDGPPPGNVGKPPTLDGPPPGNLGKPPTLDGPPPGNVGKPPTLDGPPPANLGKPPSLDGLPPGNLGKPPTLDGPPPGNVSKPTTVTGPPPANTDLFLPQPAKLRYSVRVCASNLQEVNNCKTLESAYKNHARLEVFCVNRGSFDECYDAYTDNLVDVVSLNPRLFINAIIKFIQNAFKEVSETQPKNIPVFVIKKSSKLQTVRDARLSKLCISKEQDFPSWLRTAFLFLSKITPERYTNQFSRNAPGFFTGGVQFADNPIGCLVSGTADAALLGHDSAKKKIGKVDDYELLCNPRGRRPFAEYSACNMYKLNITSSSLGTEEMKRSFYYNIADLSLFYNLDLFELAEHYKGDFSVFFSKATSGHEFFEKEFGPRSATQQQLSEFEKTNPFLVQTKPTSTIKPVVKP